MLDDAATACVRVAEAVIQVLGDNTEVPSTEFDAAVRLGYPAASKKEITAALVGLGVTRRPSGPARTMHVVSPELDDSSLLRAAQGVATPWGAWLAQRDPSMGAGDWVEEILDFLPDYI